jgi:Na+-driven multidrug efflux pump
MKNKPLTKEQIARKKVQALKDFYIHLAVFICCILLLIIFGKQLISFLTTQSSSGDFLTWIYLNIVFLIVGWGVVVGVHAFWVFGRKISFFKNWEDKKLKEYLNDKL